MAKKKQKVKTIVAKNPEAIPGSDAAAKVTDTAIPTNAPSTAENQDLVEATATAAAETTTPVDPNPSTQVLVDSILSFF